MCSRGRAIGALHHILRYMKKNLIVLRQSFHTEAREALKVSGESDYVLKEANRHLSLEGREDISESCKTTTIDVSSGTVLRLLEKRNFIAVEKKMVDMEVKEPKVYTRDTIWNISKILRYSTWESAEEQLKCLPIRWDSYTINQVLKTHPPMEKSWLFFNWASKLKGFRHDQFTYTSMLDIFGEAGRISSMKYVFQEMKKKHIKIDVVTHTSLLHWLSKDGDIGGSLKMWEEMKAKGCRPTVVSYTAFIKVLFDHNKAKEATEVYKEMIASRCSPNCYTYTVLMEYLAGSGKFTAALDIFNKMQEAGVLPDKAACNILVQMCSRGRAIGELHHILQYMKKNFIVLRQSVYTEAHEALQVSGESDYLLKEANRHLSLEGRKDISESCKTTAINVSSGIVLRLLEKRNFIAVDNVLHDTISKNIKLDCELISTIIQTNCANCRPNGALLAFRYGSQLNFNIERAAYLSLIGLFIRNNSYSELVEIVDKMIQAGVSLGTYLIFLLTFKLGCVQMFAFAEKLFDSLPNDQKNPVTYTALMGAYFHSGDVDKGIDIFNTMRRKSILASHGTYNLLMAGLKKAGRVREIESYRRDNISSDGHTQDIFPLEDGLCDRLYIKAIVM